MNTLLTALLLVASEQASSAALDPGRLIPEDLPVYVEFLEPSKNVSRLRRSAGFRALEDDIPADLRGFLDLVTGSGLSRAALGLDYSALRKQTTFILLLEGPKPKELLTQAKGIAKESDAIVFRAGPFIGIADSKGTANEVRDAATGEEGCVLDRKDFMEFRQRVTSGEIRFHVDLKRLFPLRPGVASPKDPGAALFSAHILHVVGRSREMSGNIDLSEGLELNVSAPVGRLPADRRFCVPEDAGLPVLAGPPDQAARVSLRRDLTGFWKHVEELVPEGSRPGLAEFRSNAALIMGGIPVEELFAGLGSTFDIHVGRLPQGGDGPQPRNRYPVGALVAEVRNQRLAKELLLAFQEAIGAVNLQASQDSQPRLMLGSVEREKVTILTAKYLPDLLPAKDDDRLQLAIAMAVVGNRLILGSHESLVAQLVEDAVKGRTRPREPGDVVRVTARNVKQLVEDARAAIVAGLVIDGERTVAGGQALVDRIGWFLERAKSVDVDLVFGSERAEFKLDVRAPDLWTEKPR